jgi:hypothetical protein
MSYQFPPSQQIRPVDTDSAGANTDPSRATVTPSGAPSGHQGVVYVGDEKRMQDGPAAPRQTAVTTHNVAALPNWLPPPPPDFFAGSAPPAPTHSYADAPAAYPPEQAYPAAPAPYPPPEYAYPAAYPPAQAYPAAPAAYPPAHAYPAAPAAYPPPEYAYPAAPTHAPVSALASVSAPPPAGPAASKRVADLCQSSNRILGDIQTVVSQPLSGSQTGFVTDMGALRTNLRTCFMNLEETLKFHFAGHEIDMGSLKSIYQNVNVTILGLGGSIDQLNEAKSKLDGKQPKFASFSRKDEKIGVRQQLIDDVISDAQRHKQELVRAQYQIQARMDAGMN